MKQIFRMIEEFLINRNVVKRTEPIKIEPILDKIRKYKTNLQNAIDVNQKLAAEKKKANELAAKKHKEKTERMERKLKEIIKGIGTAHKKEQELLKKTFDVERTAAESAIETARTESERAIAACDNIATITTKRPAAE